MKTIFIALMALCPAVAAVTLDQFVSVSIDSDSLGFSQGRRQLLWSGRIGGDSWSIRAVDRYLDADSGGLVPRRFLGRNDLLLNGDAEFGVLTVSPGFRWNAASGDGLDFVLPGQEGTVLDRAYLRPELGLSVTLPYGFRAMAGGSLVERTLEYHDGSSLGWSGKGAEGGLEWNGPGRLWVGAGGSFRSHSSSDIDFETDWSRIGAAVGIRTVTLPARVQIEGRAEYGHLNGEDYLGGELGDRLGFRIRAVRSFRPGLALNVTGYSSLDRKDGEWSRAVSAGAARVVLTRGRPGEIPHQFVLGGQFTSSSFSTARFEASARIHLIDGLSSLLSTVLREGPTTIAGAGGSRERVTLGAGLEYRFRDLALVWVKILEERTELSTIENWTRLEAGLRFWPHPIAF